MNKKSWKLIVGLILFFGFTQVNWLSLFSKNRNKAILKSDNSALFYTESEKAREVEFYLKKK